VELNNPQREDRTMSTPLPNETPNVNIESPKLRKGIRTAVDIIGATIFVVGAVDVAAAGFDLSWLLVPAGAGYIAVRSVFGFAVDNPNTPKS
jgi:hypothetical protein